MFSSVLTAFIQGMEILPIHVEADVSDGLPYFTMVGYASAQVKEAQERVKIAMKNIKLSLPPKRITVNLAPADVKKEGAGFDLPIAAAILTACGRLAREKVDNIMITGEIGLNGRINPINGVLPMVIKAKELHCRFCIIPKENLEEAQLVEGMPSIGVESLEEMLRFLEDPSVYQPEKRKEAAEKKKRQGPDFSEVRGQAVMKRAAEIAVSGFHNLLFIGPPGCGKTMIARRISTILPPLAFEERLELTKIYSIAGLLTKEAPFLENRPFRAPHHTASAQALAGGGRNPKPGEVTLAHKGVLFLDEMPEFSRKSLEILRQPLEEKKIVLSSVNGTYQFPADFLLLAAMNPCPCGYYPDMNRCTCTAGEVHQYLHKISQPLLDRIDLCVEAPAVTYEEIRGGKKEETSKEIQKRVARAHQVQRKRYEGLGIQFNSQLSASQLSLFCTASREGNLLLEKAFTVFRLSPRMYHRILKVARTIADMEESPGIEARHIKEALAFRLPDKKYWT